MLTREKNELVTRTGPGTPGGDLLRRYWQPVALSEELPPGGAPLPVQVLGERLVLFRDEYRRPGLLGLHCAHRAADLSFGRVEDGGLRCLYHGWLYDVQGNCLEQPAEPEGSDFYTRVKQKAYPVQEQGEVLWAYLGPGEPPCLPAYPFLTVPDERRIVNKIYQECNYLQGNEGNIDPAHLSFLHRQFGIVDTRPVPGGSTSADRLYGMDLRPTIEVQETDFGLRIFSVRKAGPDEVYVRTTNFIMPNASAIVGDFGRVGKGYSLHWHVPIDDTHHWRYEFSFIREGALDREALRARFWSEMGPDRRLHRNSSNRYLQDRDEMKDGSFSGMGKYFPAHDAFATETQGAIEDRTTERLGSTDKAIAAARQQILRGIEAVQEGRDPQHVVRPPAEHRVDELVVLSYVAAATEDWRAGWRRAAGLEPAVAAQ